MEFSFLYECYVNVVSINEVLEFCDFVLNAINVYLEDI